MNGIILVLPNPYFAKTDAEGKASLSVPKEGIIELAVFHERLKGSVEETRRAIVTNKKTVSFLKQTRPSSM